MAILFQLLYMWIVIQTLNTLLDSLEGVLDGDFWLQTFSFQSIAFVHQSTLQFSQIYTEFWGPHLYGGLIFCTQKEIMINKALSLTTEGGISWICTKCFVYWEYEESSQNSNTCGWNSTYHTSWVGGIPTMWLEIQPETMELKTKC